MGFRVISPTLIIILLSSIFSIHSTAQDLGFKCRNPSNTTCNSLIDYKLPNTTTLSSITTLFQIKNLRSLLAANNLPTNTSKDTIFNATQTLKIPFPCHCNNGTGISNRRPIYTVVPNDGLYHIAAEVFSGLVKYPQIQTVNNIPDANNISIGLKLWIPLPCSCDDVDGERVMHYGYLVGEGNTVGGIAQQFNTTEATLLDLNGLGSADDLKADSVIDVPLKDLNNEPELLFDEDHEVVDPHNLNFEDIIHEDVINTDEHNGEKFDFMAEHRRIQELSNKDIPIDDQTQIYIPAVASSLKPEVGMVFPSIDHAFEFYHKYAKASGFTARKSTSYVHMNVLRIKYVVCYKEGGKPQKLGSVNDNKKVKQRKRPSIRTGCKAFIRFGSENGKEFKVCEFVEGHNHPLVSSEDIHLLAGNRKLSHIQEEMICELSSLNMGPVKAFNVMRTKYGGFENVGATAVDCKNFKGGLNSFIGVHDADMIVSRLKDKKKYLPDYSFEYSVDEKNALTGLFWADALCKRNYMEFGDVISFDATFNTNKYKMVFVPFTGIDNHCRNVTLGAGLLSSETTESYTWLLGAFVKSFGKKPKVVVTDQDPAMKNAIQKVFDTSRHRLCMWHIMKKVSDKVGGTLCSDDEFKRRICNIVWTDSIGPDKFDFEWDLVMTDFKLTDNTWLTDMFNLRTMWIPAYYRDEPMSGLMRTTSRSESENHFFCQAANSQLTLVEFLNHFETSMEAQRFNHRKNDHDSRHTIPDFWTTFPIEKEASQIFTRSIFLDIQEEIYAAFDSSVLVHTQRCGEFLKLFVDDPKAYGQGFLEVLFKKDDDDVTTLCTCKRFEQYGLLCRHIFLVLRSFRIQRFPNKYILKRWTKDVVPNEINHSFELHEFGDDKSKEARKIAREVVFAGEYLANSLITDLEELKIVNDKMKEMINKVDERRFSRPTQNKYDRYSSLLGYDKPAETIVRLPNGIKNKGRGSHKRIKSSKEKAISRMGKRKRTCNICGEVGHDRRKHKIKTTMLQDENDEDENVEDQRVDDQGVEDQVDEQ